MAQQYLPANARERIQDLMTEHKITQNELAKASGCNESTLSRFLTGKTDKLSDENIIAIACAFNVTTDFLLGLTDVPDRTNSDLAELGLSVETGKTLYASKRASTVINAMVESKSFPALVELMYQYMEGTSAERVCRAEQALLHACVVGSGRKQQSGSSHSQPKGAGLSGGCYPYREAVQECTVRNATGSRGEDRRGAKADKRCDGQFDFKAAEKDRTQTNHAGAVS